MGYWHCRQKLNPLRTTLAPLVLLVRVTGLPFLHRKGSLTASLSVLLKFFCLSGRGKQRNISLPLVCSPDTCSSWDQDRLEPGAGSQELTLVYMHGSNSTATTMTCCFWNGKRLEWGAELGLGLRHFTSMGCGGFTLCFNCQARCPLCLLCSGTLCVYRLYWRFSHPCYTIIPSIGRLWLCYFFC